MSDFTLPPEGMLSEQIALTEYRMALGLQHIDGAGLRVVIWNGDVLRHMAPARARRWADELATDRDAPMLRPLIDALRTLAAKVDEINATVASNRAAIAAGLGEMTVEGRA